MPNWETNNNYDMLTSTEGLRYTIIDMSLNSGAGGVVIINKKFQS